MSKIEEPGSHCEGAYLPLYVFLFCALCAFLWLTLLVALKRENPVITDWVHVSGGSTEGTLGRWLAQRQAALRGMSAAGARSTTSVYSVSCREST